MLIHKGTSFPILNSKIINCALVYGYTELLKVFRAFFDSHRQRTSSPKVMPVGFFCVV